MPWYRVLNIEHHTKAIVEFYCRHSWSVYTMHKRKQHKTVPQKTCSIPTVWIHACSASILVANCARFFLKILRFVCFFKRKRLQTWFGTYSDSEYEKNTLVLKVRGNKLLTLQASNFLYYKKKIVLESSCCNTCVFWGAWSQNLEMISLNHN